jgi:hypothetical protein
MNNLQPPRRKVILAGERLLFAMHQSPPAQLALWSGDGASVAASEKSAMLGVTPGSMCSRWPALPEAPWLPRAWTGGCDGVNRNTQLPEPTDMMTDQALLLPVVHRRRGPVFKRLVGL